jgi:hypothetical protein
MQSVNDHRSSTLNCSNTAHASVAISSETERQGERRKEKEKTKAKKTRITDKS